jgi:hypothetical protein
MAHDLAKQVLPDAEMAVAPEHWRIRSIVWERLMSCRHERERNAPQETADNRSISR